MKHIFILILFLLSFSHLSGQSTSKDSLINETARSMRYKFFANSRLEKMRLIMLLTVHDDMSRSEAKLYTDRSYAFFDINKEAVDYNLKGLVSFTINGGTPDNYVLFCPKSAIIIPVSDSEWIVKIKKEEKTENFFKERLNDFFLMENNDINMSFDDDRNEVEKFFKDDLGTLFLSNNDKIKNLFLKKKEKLESLLIKKKVDLKLFLLNEKMELEKLFPDNKIEQENFFSKEKNELETFFSNEKIRLDKFFPKDKEELDNFFYKEQERLKLLFFKERAKLNKFFPDQNEEVTAFYPAQVIDIKVVTESNGSSHSDYKKYYIHLTSYDDILQFVKNQIN